MNRVILVVTVMFLSNFCIGQKLHKGNLVGVHVINITLNPDVTMEQFKSFYISEAIPAFEKHFHAKGYFLEGIRGQNKDSIAVIWLFESVKHRDMYFNEDGSFNELGKSTIEKLDSITKKMEKYGSYSTNYTDWIIQ